MRAITVSVRVLAVGAHQNRSHSARPLRPLHHDRLGNTCVRALLACNARMRRLSPNPITWQHD